MSTDPIVNTNPMVYDESKKTSAHTKAITQSASIPTSSPISTSAPIGRSAQRVRTASLQPSCPTCNQILERLRYVEGKYKKFNDRQKAEAREAKKSRMCWELKMRIIELKDVDGFSFHAITALLNHGKSAKYHVSDVTVRRAYHGEFDNDFAT